MEYADSGNLREFMEKETGPFTEPFILNFIVQMCFALRVCHESLIYHRHVKPENIFFTNSGFVKLGDFCFARALMITAVARTFTGTDRYMSPEMLNSKKYDGRHDIWGLGCILYELCTRKHPFMSLGETELRDRILNQKPAPLPDTYSQELRNLVMECLEKKPKDRTTAARILGMDFLRDETARHTWRRQQILCVQRQVYILENVIVTDQRTKEEKALYPYNFGQRSLEVVLGQEPVVQEELPGRKQEADAPPPHPDDEIQVVISVEVKSNTQKQKPGTSGCCLLV
jgi:serine/threonine protein kinase